MKIEKERSAAEETERISQVGKDELAQINAFTKTALKAEQVYTFGVRLCDNEVDRDFERFDETALTALGDLFVGKTGIFDHQWSAQGQTARIYRTEIIREPGTKTAAGDGYCYLKGWAYLLRNQKNQELIQEIEGGIKKEVSIGCSVARSLCSVCGADAGTCEHSKGNTYGGRLCYTELREPVDAYEWSFVAVPAQRQAGVLKKYTPGTAREAEALTTLKQQAALGEKYLTALRNEVVRLALLADDTLNGTVFEGIAGKLDEPELLELRRAYEAKAEKRFPPHTQLQPRREARAADEAVFLI